MVKHEISFSHDYPKLDAPFFTTIRRRDDYPTEGTLVKIKTPTRVFFAFVVLKVKMKLGDISSALLWFDTGEGSRTRAVKLIQSFYRTPIKDDEKLTILFLLKHTTGLEIEQTKIEVDQLG